MPSRRAVRPRANPVRIIALTVKTQDSDVSETLQSLRTGLAESGVEPETLGRLEIALAEALNNVTEHGHDRRGENAMHISAKVSDREIRVQIRDTGAPVPEDFVDAACLPDNSGPLQSLPEGGFGWFLIHQLADEVAYRRHQDENQLELVFFRV